MSNPADQLHEIFTQWAAELGTGGNTIANVRGSSIVSATMEGLRLVDQIEQGVEGLERLGLATDLHRANILIWREQLLAYPHGWSSNVASQSAHPDASMNSLEVLGQLLSIAEPNAHQDSPALDTSKVEEFVAEIREALDVDGTLPDVFREYIQSLIETIESAMVHRDSDTLREDLQHLWISVFAAAEASDDVSTWRTLAQKYGGGFAIQTLAGITSGIVAHSITGG